MAKAMRGCLPRTLPEDSRIIFIPRREKSKMRHAQTATVPPTCQFGQFSFSSISAPPFPAERKVSATSVCTQPLGFSGARIGPVMSISAAQADTFLNSKAEQNQAMYVWAAKLAGVQLTKVGSKAAKRSRCHGGSPP